MSSQFIAAAREWLSGHTAMGPEDSASLSRIAAQLAEALPTDRTTLIAVSGAPGTGKSTLADACAEGLRAGGARPLVLALDDYYLPLAERQGLAASRHPLLERRGAPGTHDIRLLRRHIEALQHPGHKALELPCFDKARDDRSPQTRKVEAGLHPDPVFLEGWMVGVPAQADSELEHPVNDLEARQDPEGHWRRWTNRRLAEYHEALAPFIRVHWHLDAPDWDCVIDWRWQQEQERGSTWLRSRAEVRAFLQTYQRIGLHMHRSCAQWADAIITLDPQHRPRIRQKT